MRPQTKGAGSTDIFRVNAPQTPHHPGAGLNWRDNSDYTALGPTHQPDKSPTNRCEPVTC